MVGVKIIQIFCTNDKETIIFKRIFMIECFIFELGCSNSEKALKWDVNSRLILTWWRVREARHFPVVESKATAGKP